ncbi:MAG: C39 family peptidase [Oscillospiraceae bacterium]|nr:C39 family peptidase [Oscillospiraceae bacterium]
MDSQTLSRLPERLQRLYEKNPDARGFVAGYEENKDRDFDIDLSEYEDCSKVPLLMQWDKRWGYKDYSGSLFALTGCGPTCLSMCAIYLTGDATYTPEYMRNFALENDYSVEGNGSKWTLISEGGEQLGLDVTEIPLDEERTLENLRVGNPVICIMGPGDFTEGGHFIVLAGADDEGNITVNDPNSYVNSDRTWRFSEISDQIDNLWVLR